VHAIPVADDREHPKAAIAGLHLEGEIRPIYATVFATRLEMLNPSFWPTARPSSWIVERRQSPPLP
jgi:hypothetical protein